MKADVEIAKSRVGVAFTTGRSFILHREPVAGMVRIGIDATWFDLNYALYKELAGDKYTMHQADIAMGIGPGVHVNPIDKLGIHAYVRYNPTFATLFNTGSDGGLSGGYSSVFVCGGAVSWGLISLGIEGRWGKATYHDFTGGGDDDDGGFYDDLKLKTKGLRAYVSFRF